MNWLTAVWSCEKAREALVLRITDRPSVSVRREWWQPPSEKPPRLVLEFLIVVYSYLVSKYANKTKLFDALRERSALWE